MLSIYDFGRQLVETGDLDPVYLLLHGAQLEPPLLYRWLLGYWCFYNVGTACWVCESYGDSEVGYWAAMGRAANSKDYPRCHERRHFRGENARKSVAYLKDRGIDSLFRPLIGEKGTITEVLVEAEPILKEVQTWVGFGPWIAFKVADMLERLGLRRLMFDRDTVLYDSPRAGAEMLWNEENKGKESAQDTAVWASNKLLSRLKDLKAPPRYERYLNLQEAETILCKWHAHRGGHYTVGEDIAACRKGLLAFGRNRLCQRMLSVGREKKLW